MPTSFRPVLGRRRAVLAATGGLLVLAGVAVAGLARAGVPGFDFARVPPPHAETEASLRERGVTLVEAIETVQTETEGGVVADASYVTRLAPLDSISVLVYHDEGTASRLFLDADTGDIIDRIDVPRIPGWEVEGDPGTGERGTMWWTLEEGAGSPPAADASNVKMEYVGYLLDGTIFDSSERIGRPITVPLGSLLPGWAEGMRTMKPGERRKIVFPPELAFGGIGSPPNIPPHATLIVDVTLLAIVDYQTVPTPPPGAAVEGEPVELEGGLRYWVLAEGEGDPVPDTDAIVELHYTGYLTDGEVFTTTRPEGTDGTPQRIQLRRWIVGAGRGTVGMRPGERRKLIIPSDLGYGNQARRGVPPRATLIMDIECLGMVDR